MAWGGYGHLVVARIAYDMLKKNGEDHIIDQVNDLLYILKHKDMGTWTIKEGNWPMVECVCYADDIKYKGGVYQSTWHFLNFAYFDKGGDIDDYRFKAPKHNITEAIDGLTKWINKEDGYDETYIYEMMVKKSNSTEEGLS
jgi:hypothetical protein